MKKNDKTIKRLILISNKESEVCFFKSLPNENENENKNESPNKPKQDKPNQAYVTFDPEIFLIDNPDKINEVLNSVKFKVDDEFRIFDKYEEAVTNFSNKTEIKELLTDRVAFDKLDSSSINQLIETKFKNYNEESKLEIKLCLLMRKSLNQIENCNKDIKNDLDELKNKLFSTTNSKNKNLMNLTIESEIKKEEFKKYIIEKLKKDGKLNPLFEKKNKNEELIALNKMKIKKEEKYLLDTFYCVKCRIRPRNAISMNCHHLMTCEECIKKAKVCPRCGIDIDKFEKVYRS